MKPTTRCRVALVAVVATTAIACSEVAPEVKPNAATPPPRGVEAELVVSNMAPAPGSEVVLLTRVRGGSDVRRIGSFTARVAYDTTRLQLLGEEPLGDAATRALNPAAGEARIAGITTEGFADGELFALRFRVLQESALSTLQVAFDELHASDGTDLQERVQVARTPVPRSVK